MRDWSVDGSAGGGHDTRGDVARSRARPPNVTHGDTPFRDPCTHRIVGRMDPTPAAPPAARATIGEVAPILRVADLDATIAYYRDRLGFVLHWRDGDVAAMGRDRATLMFCEREQGHAGTWVYLGTDDADALHREVVAAGAMVRLPPGNYPWGARELHLTDPDGHVLRFGADAVPGAPMGDWIDGAGQRWRPTRDGGWERATA